MNNYTLNVQDGRVRYIMKQGDATVASYTSQQSAEWMLRQFKPFASTEFPGYEIKVKSEKGDEYFFDGEWQRAETCETCRPDYCDIEEPQEKPKRRRRTKDIVCEQEGGR